MPTHIPDSSDSSGRSPGYYRQAAILSADVVGYTRLMEADESGTHSRLMRLRFSIMEPVIARHQGRVVKNTGDGFLAMFDNAIGAMRAAQEMQRAIMAAEADIPNDRRIAFRMGANVADVIVEDHDIYGDGVNVAARLQSHAEPGGIVISGLVAEEIGGTLGMNAIDLGQMQMRNRIHPVRVLSLRFPDAPPIGVGEVQPGHDARPSIAVLPFRKLTMGDDSYFADGIVDNIIHALAGLKELFVIARGSTLGFGGGPIDARAIGNALGVRYLLYGSAQRGDKRLRIATELIETDTNEVVRADHYDGDLQDLFDLQDEIAEGVAKAIAPRVRERELKRALRKHPQNMTAYDLVLQALEFLYRLDYPSFSRARGLLQRAMVTDPTYAPAFALAARWHSLRVGQEWSPDVAADRLEAERLAAAAIALDESDALAWAVHGHQKSFLMRNFSSALESFERALSACPNLALAWTYSAATYCFLGDGPEAVRRAQTGLQLSPLDAHVFFAEHILSQSHYVNGDLDAAVAWATKADRRNPRLTSNLRVLAASLSGVGEVASAREVAIRHAEVVPSFTLKAWAARTPLSGPLLEAFIERLVAAGFPR